MSNAMSFMFQNLTYLQPKMEKKKESTLKNKAFYIKCNQKIIMMLTLLLSLFSVLLKTSKKYNINNSHKYFFYKS